MNLSVNQRSGNITAILLIVALVVGIASTVLIITIARTSPQTSTSAASRTDIKPLLPPISKSTASAQPTGFSFSPTSSLPAGTPATTSSALSTVTILTPGDMNVETALSTDKTTFVTDFIATSFTSISLITYNIAYTADASGSATAKNINGSFSPATVLITGYKTSGYPYIRKSFTLGTCSGVTCVYDTNPRGFAVSVSTKLSSL